jgi:predicted O-methyltransferase YrrM
MLPFVVTYRGSTNMIPRIVTQLPGYRSARRRFHELVDPFATNPFVQYAPPGHFYSPLPDLEFIERHRARLFDRGAGAVSGIDNNIEQQLALVEQFARFYPELPFPIEKSADLRYYFNNQYFGYADAVILYSMLRYYRPHRVIEVGSGFSSAVMLDTNDRFLEGRLQLTFIEPFPERLLSLMTSDDRARTEIISAPVQEVTLDRFESLQAGDLLFIDSSHMAKVGSDVVHLLTHVLPMLATGVIVHFHDVFWPFEYPEEWIRLGRAWNEAYFLKAFLQFNASFRILLFNSYLNVHHREVLERRLPLFLKDGGGSLWIARIS